MIMSRPQQSPNTVFVVHMVSERYGAKSLHSTKMQMSVFSIVAASCRFAL